MKKKYLGFHCPTDLYEWLRDKGEKECRNMSNCIVHSLQIVKEQESGKESK